MTKDKGRMTAETQTERYHRTRRDRAVCIISSPTIFALPVMTAWNSPIKQ
ncbi:MAG: hypothetical protein ACLFV6_07735 [Spirulinaceae cyanobacterium]